MKYIIKNMEPPELIEYKQTPGATFEGWGKKVRDAVKESLVNEQGYICCYCQKAIEISPKTIIEHFMPREYYRQLSLEYGNLFASCDGGQGERALRDDSGRRINKLYPEHCDSKKGSRILPMSPLKADCETYFKYKDTGEICPHDSDELSEKHLKATECIRLLNLDNTVLRNLRKAEFDGYIGWSQDELAREIEKLKQKKDGRYYNFATAIIYYLENYYIPLMAV